VSSLVSKPRSSAEAAAWLARRFRLSEVRDGQADVVAGLLAGRRLLFVAPTGHGKSLCYQALAASPWSRGVVLVFQPLKALMHEQVERAQRVGLVAEAVNSDLEPDHQQAILERATAGELQILFLSPERQGNSLWLECVGKLEIKGVVIDEAHCISQWGHDFRPWYQRLVRTVMGLGVRTPVLALTATAPEQVIEDVRHQIGPGDETIEVIRMPSHRPNLELSCWIVDDLASRLAALLLLARRERGAPGIAYLLTRDEARIAAGFLESRGVAAEPYHAGLSAEDRSSILQRWYQGGSSVLCATSALGMGIDRADVRWIVHAGLPDSLLRYVQEIGRAGRDGRAARITGIHDESTQGTYEAFIRGSMPSPEDYAAVVSALRAGHTKRTDIVLAKDIPDSVVQRILDDFVEGGLSLRASRAPYTYEWIGGDETGVPEGLAEAVAQRRELLQHAIDLARHDGCLAIQLARAMGDATLPSPCGRCDRCRGDELPAVGALVDEADAYLASFCPPIAGVRAHHEPGLSLGLYGMGRIGREVKAAKYGRRSLAPFVLEHALERLGDVGGPYAGVWFDAVVSVPSATSMIVAEFSSALASRLGVPWLELLKLRQTRPQKQLRARQNKRRNIEDAFGKPAKACFGCVLLVDDVIDSGESLRAASVTLRPARVHPLALARAKHQDDQ